jgi:hypothetical protein
MDYQLIIEEFISRNTTYSLYQKGGDDYILYKDNLWVVRGTYIEIAHYILTLNK